MHPTPKAEVKFDGALIDDDLKSRLSRIEVDDHLILPDTFAVFFHDPRSASPDDPQRGTGSFPVVIGATAEIGVSPAPTDDGQEPPVETLIEGEVTAIEAVYDDENSFIVVRGYDKTHRLHRGRKTKSYTQITDGDLVQEAATDAALSVGQVDDPNTQVEHFSRLNLTGWELLQSRAKGTGREARVTDGQLDFRTPTPSTDAPSSSGTGSTDPKVLHFRDNLLAFSPRLTAPQHGKVEARGWDPVQKAELKSSPVDVTSAGASLNDQPNQLANLFGTPVFMQPSPFSIQKEVDDAATALAEQIGSTFAEAEGTARGHPQLKAGVAVQVDNVSEEFKGSWTVTGSHHVLSWEPGFGEPYVTHLQMTGRQDRSLSGLTSEESTNGALGSGSPVYGVVVGIVTDTKDPDSHGRVKVKLPWLSDDFVSDWAWVVQPGAGDKRGQVVVPEVNDLVLVAFFMGNPRYPYVIGSLYNGQEKADTADGEPVDGSSGEVTWRGFVSRKGHRIVFFDKDGSEFVQLRTGDSKYSLKLDKQNTIIELTSDGKITITGKQDITVKGDANIKVEAGGNLDEKASGNVKIEASGNMELKGAMVKIEGSGPVTVKGNPIQLN